MEFEDYAYLDEVMQAILDTGLPKMHWSKFKKYHDSIRSTKMVKIFLAKKICSTSAEAVMLGQRLWDANRLVVCTAPLAQGWRNPDAKPPSAETLDPNTPLPSGDLSSASGGSPSPSRSPSPVPARGSSPVPHRGRHRRSVSLLPQAAPFHGIEPRHKFKKVKLLYYLNVGHPPLKGIKKGDQFALLRRNDIVHGRLDLQGAHRVLPAYAVLDRSALVLTLFQNKQLRGRKLDVLDLSCASYFMTDSSDEELEVNNRRGSVALSSPAHSEHSDDSEAKKGRHTAKSSADSTTLSVPTVADSEPLADNMAPKSPHCFLYLFLPHNTYTFRIDDAESREQWVAGLQEVGMVSKTLEEVKDVISEKTVLDMRDVMDTPEYRELLVKFLKSQYALENLKFLEAVDSYRQLNDAVERKTVALHIFAQFIVDSAPELVNLDSNTFAEVKNYIESNRFRKMLFDNAYDCVYKMMQRDVYMRFVTSPSYHEILESMQLEPKERRRRLNQAETGPKPRGRRLSMMQRQDTFVIPAIDDVKRLREATRMARDSDIVRSHRRFLSKFADSFAASDLIDWLLTNGYAKIRPSAEAFGQRMLDACLIRPVNSKSFEFADGKGLFTFELPKELEEAHTYGEAVEALADVPEQDKWIGPLLLKGVKYLPVHAAVNIPEKSVLLYRSEVPAAKPFMILRLKRVSVEEVQLLDKARSNAFSRFGMEDGDDDDGEEDDDADADADDALKVEDVARYLDVDTCTFRLYTAASFATWQGIAERL